MRLTVSALLVVTIGVLPVVTQRSSAQEKLPAFDVVSIKPMKATGRSYPGLLFSLSGVESAPGGGVTPKLLIAAAYQLTEQQISGGPGWIASDLYALQARTGSNAGRDDIRLMLQSLLSERFKFVASHIKKEMPVFALTVRKGGPGPIRYRSNPGADSTESTGYHKVDGSTPLASHTGGPGMVFKQVTMEDFARSLSQIHSLSPGSLLLLDRPVVDRTGLQGGFSFPLTWNDDNDLTVALQDELGIRLESQKAEVDALVIGHIEKPSAN